MQVTDPFIGRYPNAPNQDMIQVVGPGGGILWRLSQTSTTWFSGTGTPTTSAFPGALSGNLYLDTSTGNIWQLSSRWRAARHRSFSRLLEPRETRYSTAKPDSLN
jgi:hypothetical protein